MQLQLQILKINTRSSHLAQYHLKDVQGKNHTKLENQECWHYSRMCSLGTQCDMFEYDASTSNCRYFPHLQLKNKRLVDFLQPHTNMHNTVRNLEKHFDKIPWFLFTESKKYLFSGVSTNRCQCGKRIRPYYKESFSRLDRFIWEKKLKYFYLLSWFIVTQTCTDAACSCTDTGLAEDPIGPGKYYLISDG